MSEVLAKLGCQDVFELRGLIGTLKIYQDQRYLAVAVRPYLRKDGTTSAIVTWQSHCAQCGQAFTFDLGASVTKFYPNRRCQKHKRPSQRVRTHARRRRCPKP